MKKIFDVLNVVLLVLLVGVFAGSEIYDAYFCSVETKNVTVTVEYGDTLWNIAEREFSSQNKYRSMDEFLCSIYDANKNLTARIQPGQKIIVPLSKKQ